MKYNNCLGFVFVWSVLASTYVMRNSHEDSFRYFYISDLLNTSKDPVWMFAIRWCLWFASLPVIFIPMRRLTNSCAAWNFALSWIACVVSGIKLEVFGLETPSFMRYLHYAGTGLVLQACVVFMYALGRRRLSILWSVISIAYCVSFLVSLFSSSIDIPTYIYKTIEFVLYLQVTYLSFFTKSKAESIGESAEPPRLVV